MEGPAQYNTLLTTQQLGRGRPQFQVSKSQAGGNFHLKVGGAKSSGNAGDPMMGVAVIP